MGLPYSGPVESGPVPCMHVDGCQNIATEAVHTDKGSFVLCATHKADLDAKLVAMEFDLKFHLGNIKCPKCDQVPVGGFINHTCGEEPTHPELA